MVATQQGHISECFYASSSVPCWAGSVVLCREPLSQGLHQIRLLNSDFKEMGTDYPIIATPPTKDFCRALGEEGSRGFCSYANTTSPLDIPCHPVNGRRLPKTQHGYFLQGYRSY